MKPEYNLSNYDYSLPKELIAEKPLKKRDMSKLMVVKGKEIVHKHFYNIIDYLHKGDVLVINNAKVNQCKIFGRKITGSSAEIILTEKLDDKIYKAHIKSTHPKVNTRIVLNNSKIYFDIVKKEEDYFTIKFSEKPDDYIKKHGELPLPYYIKRHLTKNEQKKYQTIFSKNFGSIAAPTAGLHFTKELLGRIKRKGVKIAEVTLHIGFGTFRPIREEDVRKHKMHSEYFEIDKKNASIINNYKGRLFVVGTTSLRALEAAKRSRNGNLLPTKKATDIFIYPGYKFKSGADALITNFHLPKSTLLVLVSAFSSPEIIKKAYAEAIEKRYRFYSLGDAMLLYRR
jgi:S-adenosylmethionine:tRNA ribosyltransferase-isomerase